jgi:hypothetical protein
VQDIAQQHGLYEITTGSLVSYPHPYRILEFQQTERGEAYLRIESAHVTQVPDWPDLLHHSREWMGDRSLPFMLKLLTQPPLNVPVEQAEQFAPDLRYFWADIAQGDSLFDFPHFPAAIQEFLASFGAVCSEGKPRPIDNFATLRLR